MFHYLCEWAFLLLLLLLMDSLERFQKLLQLIALQIMLFIT
jgi:hypothetical protein